MLLKKAKLSLFSLLFGFSLLVCANPVNQNFVKAEGNSTDAITFGKFDLKSGTFKDATGTEFNTYKGINISLASDITGDEVIVLPEVEGYEIAEDISTDYSKIIKTSEEKTAKDIVDEYVTNVVFKNCLKGKLSVTLSKEVMTNKIAYFADNDHFYQYVKYDEEVNEDNPNVFWTQAYNDAKALTFMGRQGYLATITSLEEDSFIYKVTSTVNDNGVVESSVGWLGGTMLIGNNKSGNYYESFTTKTIDQQPLPSDGSGYEDHWYWACGPEIGETFFASQVLDTTNDDSIAKTYQDSADLGYYFNWNTNSGGAKDAMEPNKGNPMEPCLTTLNKGSGYSTSSDSNIYNYSWNNLNNDLQNAWINTPDGYIVEFGNRKYGDSNTEGSTEYFTGVGSFHSHTESNYVEWTSTTSLPTEAGCYYLADDVYLTNTWVVPTGDVELCLNGHVLCGDLTFNLITVNEGSNLQIISCETQTQHWGYLNLETYLYTYDPTFANIGENVPWECYGGLLVGGKTAIQVNGGYVLLNHVNFSGNKGENGGAINIGPNSECIVIESTFEYNAATDKGGAIYNEGKLTLFGAFVAGNTAAIKGGGIYHDGESLIIGDHINILYNDFSETGSNLFLCDGKFITFDSTLHPLNPYGDDAIYLSCENGEGLVAKIDDIYRATPYCIVSENELYKPAIVNNSGVYEVYLKKVNTVTTDKPKEDKDTNHGYLIHDYDIYYGFEGTGMQISVVCEDGYIIEPGSVVVSNEDGEIPVIYTGKIDNDGETTYFYFFLMPNSDVTITANFIEGTNDKLYNEVSSCDVIEAIVGQDIIIDLDAEYNSEDITFFYTFDGITFTSEPPTQVGTYDVLVVIGGNDVYETNCLYFTVDFEKNTSNEITTLSIEDWVEGETPSVPVAESKFGEIEFTYSTEEDGTYTSTIPTEPGTYYLKASVEDTDNYNGDEKIVSFNIIGKNEITSLSIENWTTGENPSNPTGESKYGTIEYLYSTEEDGTYTSTVPTEPGTYYLKAYVAAGDGYTEATKIISFEILEAPVVTTTNTCFYHWILIGLLVLSIVLTLLYCLIKFKAVIAEILLALLFIGTLVVGYLGAFASCCQICLIVGIIGAVLIVLEMVFVPILNKKRKEDKKS